MSEVSRDLSYDAVMARRGEIMKKALGLEYDEFILSDIAFDYEGMMERAGYSLEEVRQIQQQAGVGEHSPLGTQEHNPAGEAGFEEGIRCQDSAQR
jgi:hypothetical protein